MRSFALGLALAALAANGQTMIDLRTQARDVDFSSAPSTRPARTGTALPASCRTGELFFKTDETAGQNLYGCTTSGVWNRLGGAGSLPAFSGQQGKALYNDGSAALWGQAVKTIAPGAGLVAVCSDGAGPSSGDCWLYIDDWYAATQQGSNIFRGANDFSGAASLQARSGSALPATCKVAEVFFITSAPAGQNWYGCTSPNTWTRLGGATNTDDLPEGTTNRYFTDSRALAAAHPYDASIFVLKDDFPSVRPDVSPTGELPWNATGTMGTVTQSAATAGHPGVRSATTGNTNGNSAALRLDYGTATNFYNLGASSEFATWEIHNIVLLDNVSGVNPLANMGYHFGFSTSGGGCGGQGWCIVADAGSPSGACNSGTWNPADWMYISIGPSSATTCVDSGVAVNSGTWYHLRITSTSKGQATFTVNGAAAQTISTTLPTASLTTVMAAFTRTNGAKAAWHDYFSFVGRGLTR